jgi:hypothetical protein
MLQEGNSPKTVRNVISFLHSVFEQAIRMRAIHENPVKRPARPKRRRLGDANPDLRYLTVRQLDVGRTTRRDDASRRRPARREDAATALAARSRAAASARGELA